MTWAATPGGRKASSPSGSSRTVPPTTLTSNESFWQSCIRPVQVCGGRLLALASNFAQMEFLSLLLCPGQFVRNRHKQMVNQYTLSLMTVLKTYKVPCPCGIRSTRATRSPQPASVCHFVAKGYSNSFLEVSSSSTNLRISVMREVQ